MLETISKMTTYGHDLIREGFRGFVENEEWRDTSWSDNTGEKVTIHQILDYLTGHPIVYVPIQDIPAVGLDLEPDRIKAANVDIPIILVKNKGQYTFVLDGNHRLKSVINSGSPTIKSRILDLDNPQIPQQWKSLFERM